eukprot:4635396-Amphidinium_carterae.1
MQHELRHGHQGSSGVHLVAHLVKQISNHLCARALCNKGRPWKYLAVFASSISFQSGLAAMFADCIPEVILQIASCDRPTYNS